MSCFEFVFSFFFGRLGHSDVFNLIHQHNLFNSIQDKIIMLMDFDKEVNSNGKKMCELL